ncbi:MAG TPA: tetratricopeptide repeat protein, partial [Longimicrobiales bacterium]|nr:tetratricopeptide repeat protein [Longimicrobiales bacterium]
LYGDVVNTAARLQGEAEADHVLVSDDVWKQLRNRRSLVFTEAGPRVLKGKAEPVMTFVATRRYLPAPPASEDAAEARDQDRRRLVVLPFQVHRPDPEVDFLAFGLPDAVSSSLVGLSSLVVRAPPALPSGSPRVDPRVVARAAEADLVLSGTVQRAGDQVRVSTELADGRHGTLLWKETSTMELGDLFELQDDLTRRIVESLAAPLTAEERDAISRHVPGAGDAYELYLRANQVAVAENDWTEGVELYRRALDADPDYAPAWARLGRCYRLLAKYVDAPEEAAADRRRAEEAFEKALELDPELALGHNLFAHFEVEAGRPVDALVRLLRRAARHPNEVELFVGLTHAARYCGLSMASIAAHERAVELDPAARTSVAYSYLQAGKWERALETAAPQDPARLYALQSLGRVEEGRHAGGGARPPNIAGVFQDFERTVLATSAGDRERALEHGQRAIEGFPDPEGRYFVARCWAALGALDEALDVLATAVTGGFLCVDGLNLDPMFSDLRSTPSFGALLERADAGRKAALDAFRQWRGPELLPAARAAS